MPNPGEHALRRLEGGLTAFAAITLPFGAGAAVALLPALRAEAEAYRSLPCKEREERMTNVYRAAVLAVCLVALGSLTAQAQNTAYGDWALYSNTTGTGSSAFGYGALYSNTTGNYNSGIGYLALLYNTTGEENTAFGLEALYSNTTGSYNLAYGPYALYQNTAGRYNAAYGPWAMFDNTTGNSNTAVGYLAGYYNTTGSWNIYLGSRGGTSDNNTIRIGEPNYHTSFYVTGVYGTKISGAVPVYINSNGQLGTVMSSIRFKEDVHDMADASSGLLRLRPVTFRYKQPETNGSKPIDYGLIAEEVAKVYPDMVVTNADGQVETVQYQKLTPMLLNELQKQERTIRSLEERLAALETALLAR
jgi:hypothetical protein